MGDGRWTNSISLRFFSVELSVDEMAAALGVQPDESYRIGEPITARCGAVVCRQSNALYLHSGLADSSPLDEHLDAVLYKAEGAARAVQTLAGRVTMDVSCTLSSRNDWRGCILSAARIKALSNLGLDVLLEFRVHQVPSDGCASNGAEPGAAADPGDGPSFL